LVELLVVLPVLELSPVFALDVMLFQAPLTLLPAMGWESHSLQVFGLPWMRRNAPKGPAFP